MTRFLAIIENTIKEGIAKKTIFTLFILITIINIFFLLALGAAEDTMFVFGQNIDEIPDELMRTIESGVVGFFYQVSLFVGIFAIASFFPSMQEKGTVDLLLSRPMSRANIFLAKYIGCMLIVFSMILYLILGTWIIFYLKTGIAHIEYLYTIPIFMLVFSAFMAFLAMTGVIFRNTSTTAILAIFFPFIFSAVTFGFHTAELFKGNGFWYYLFEGAYLILPKTTELAAWNISLIAGKTIDWNFDMPFVVISTLVFALVCYLIGVVIFRKRSY